jgi:two-component system CheB/CheR fusion protein
MASQNTISREDSDDEARSGARPVFVGIGVSPGALHALERFSSLVSADSGLIFVVVQQLERNHPSVLAELLGKHTQMPVQQAEDGVRPLPNNVYTIPPNTSTST